MADKAMGGVTPGAITRSYQMEGGDLTRGYGVMAGTGDDQVKTPTGAAVRCVGVLEEDAKETKTGSVVLFGPCVAIAGAAIARGDRVKVMATGKWEPGNGADVETGGFALTHADADTDEFVMFVDPIHKRS